MDLREAKATSKLLHALAGDTALDPVTAAAVLETLSVCAGSVLQVDQILTPPGMQAAVSAATSLCAPVFNPDTTGGSS